MFVRTKREENVVLLEDSHRFLLLVSREDVSRNHFGVLRSVIIRPTRSHQPMNVGKINVS